MQKQKEAPETLRAVTEASIQHKYTQLFCDFIYQRRKVLAYWQCNVGTMKMASVATGIDRANVCRYVAELEKYSQITRLKKGLCEVTGDRAYYFTAQSRSDE